jgi:competence protein ComEC
MIFRLAIGVLMGVCWVQLQPALPNLTAFVWPIVLSCIAFGMLWRWHRPLTGWLWPVLVAICAAFFATVFAQHQLDQRLPDELDRQSVWLQVVVNDLPTRHERGWRFEVTVQSAFLQSSDGVVIQNFPRHGVLHWYETDIGTHLAPGQVWGLQARVRQPAGTLNPGGFDYEAWMFEKKLYFSGTVQQGKKHSAPALLGRTTGFQTAIDQARDAIRQAVNTAIAESSTRDVIAALLVGDQRAISSADWAIFSRTGVSHLMSISGLHVTMLAGLAGWVGAMVWRLLCVWPIAAALWVPVQSVRALCATGGAIGYAMLAGFAVPAQRTALMVTVVSCATILGIRANPWAVLAAALLLVIATDPIAVLAPGFWLSFMAVGFLFALPRADSESDSLSRNNPGRWTKTQRLQVAVVSGLQNAGHAQLAITFGLLPITVMFFQQIVVVGPLANAVAIPVVSFIVTPLAMAGVAEYALASSGILLKTAAWVQEVLEVFLQWCAGLSLASIDWPAPGVLRTVIASIGMWIALGRVLPFPYARFRHLGWLGLVALIGVSPDRPAPGDMEVTFIDVGQGASALIRTHGHTMLVDTGPKFGDADAGQRMILPTLRRYGVRQLDRVMISHGDQDHDGGYASIAAAMSILLTQSPVADDPVGAQPCRAGDHWQWDGVRFDVLHPVAVDEKDRNASSCVLRIRNAQGGSLLLAGDIPQKTEQELVARYGPQSSVNVGVKMGTWNGVPSGVSGGVTTGASSGADLHHMSAPLSSQVVLAPHHGSKTSSSAEFLRAVGPELVVIQAGFRNRFGHPHADVLARIRERPGIGVVRTDLGGALTLRWHDRRPVITDFWADHQRYWHLRRRPG